MKYSIERAAVMLSVTELCSLALSGGDLDLRPGMGKRVSFERAALGAAIHRKIQSQAGVLYDAERPFCNTTQYEGVHFEVSGRADGILATDPPTVDEIKTVSARRFELPPHPMHDAQLRCYAFFLARERDLEQVCVRLTYYCIDTDEIRYFETVYTAEELQVFYENLLSRVLFRAKLLIDRETVLRPSVHSAHFPYSSVRDGQDILIRECYRDIRAGKRLFAEAPTGTGKTLSTLYPAMRALGEGHCDKIFYLTAKAAVRREAFRAAEQLFRAGTHLRTIILTAREQICVNVAARADPAGVSAHCNPVDCPCAKGFYDRLPDAIRAALTLHHGFSLSSILEIAAQYQVCPYEFQLALSELCDTVICDYNYIFDPMVYLRRYLDPEAVRENRYVFLVDEAHNLADRAMSMYSASLDLNDLSAALQQIPETEETLFRAIEKLSVPMVGFRRLCEENLYRDEDGREHGYYISRTPLEQFHKSVYEVRSALDAWLRKNRGTETEGIVQRLYSALKRFEVISEQYDDKFLTFIELDGDHRVIRLICLDPSRVLNTRLSCTRASVLFSATLTPSDYFADILGGGKDAVRISLPSPFSAQQFCLAAVASVSTRMENREKSYGRIASLIAAASSGKKGNYIAYFPSYQYMENVLERFRKKYPKVACVVQTRGMNPDEREAFLASFRDDGHRRIGFCVLGGSFSEGIDLPGGQLIGTVIVGTGLPGISNERNILRDYYETTRERGFDYAYTYPGMNRVMQAAGRVIRREEDRGVIVLIDDRYADPRLTQLFPDHWNHIQYANNSAELAEIVAEFWNTTKKDP
ncbi:MAG: ATP-dependent DNA helicase [Clostridia bacterium]|nr:ATP-dependent DNA helicase [Clostridia bacterium]